MPAYRVQRVETVLAPAEAVEARVVDLRRWQEWSPWEGLDPDLERTYSEPSSGVGARYAWSGNRRAGRGTMEVVEVTGREVRLVVTFEKPFRSTSDVTLSWDESTERGQVVTGVTWTMTGEQTGLMGALGRVVPMDKIIGGDLAKGLARLKDVAEREHAQRRP